MKEKEALVDSWSLLLCVELLLDGRTTRPLSAPGVAVAVVSTIVKLEEEEEEEEEDISLQPPLVFSCEQRQYQHQRNSTTFLLSHLSLSLSEQYQAAKSS